MNSSWSTCPRFNYPDRAIPGAPHLTVPVRPTRSVPVGFVGVEERSDAVVGEPAEPEGDAIDAIVDRLGGTPVADLGAVPVHDRDVPAGQGPTQTAQLRRAIGIGEIVRKCAAVGAGEQGAVDVIEAAEGFPVPAWEAAVMRAGRRWHCGAGHSSSAPNSAWRFCPPIRRCSPSTGATELSPCSATRTSPQTPDQAIRRNLGRFPACREPPDSRRRKLR